MVRDKQNSLVWQVTQFICTYNSGTINAKETVPSNQTKHKNHRPLNEQIVTKAITLEWI
jgi:hypothetical protein